MNVGVYVVGTLSTIMLLGKYCIIAWWCYGHFSISMVISQGYGIYKTYQSCQIAKAVIQKSKDTVLMISNYSIKSISKTLKRKTLEKMQNNEKEKAKASKTMKETPV